MRVESQQTTDYTLFYENRNANHHLETFSYIREYDHQLKGKIY